MFSSFKLIFKDVLRTIESASKKRHDKSEIQGPVYMTATWQFVIYPVDICRYPSQNVLGKQRRSADFKACLFILYYT